MTRPPPRPSGARKRRVWVIEILADGRWQRDTFFAPFEDKEKAERLVREMHDQWKGDPDRPRYRVNKRYVPAGGA